MPLTGPHLALPSDTPALATCHTAAFSSPAAPAHTLYNLIFSACDPAALIALETGVIAKSFAPGSRSRIVVMRDGEGQGEIVSYAQWVLPVGDGRGGGGGGNGKEGEEVVEMVEKKDKEKQQLDLPDGVNAGLFKMMFIDGGVPPGENSPPPDLPVPAEKCWHLSRIGTKPEHRGQGAARALVKWATDQADLNGEFCNLSTDPEQPAFRAYEKAGFRVVGGVSDIDLGPFGLEGRLKYVKMLREPRGICA